VQRSLSRFDALCLGLNAIVGSGIFLLPDDLYRELGVFSPLAFVACACGLLPIAYCYAVAAGQAQASGGPYVYARAAFGVQAGFAVGWICFVNGLFSFAAVASAAAGYAGYVAPLLGNPVAQRVLAVALIGAFAALNYRGVKLGALAVDGLTVGKVLVLAIVIVALLPHFDTGRLQAAPGHWGGLGRAAFLALFAAQGFEVVPVPAGEARAPQKDLPFAIVSSLLTASVVYVLVQLVLLGAAPDLGKVSDAPLADAALHVQPILGSIVLLGGAISTLGFVSGSALGTPRYVYACAVDGLLPRWLARLHPRFQVPHHAVLVTAAGAAVMALAFDYQVLVGMSNVAVAGQYLATCLAVAKQTRGPASSSGVLRGWRRLVPWAGVLVSLGVFTQASREELLWAAVSLALGAAIARLVRQRSARLPQ
jgi:amino acid transporter